MSIRNVSIGLFALVLVPTGLVTACSSEDADPDEDDSSVSTDELKGGRKVGSLCDAKRVCAVGLVCKPDQSGPPPGAMGMPIKGATSTGTTKPSTKSHCAEPAPGDEGARCFGDSDCNVGLKCDDVPLKAEDGGSASSGPPPGAMGMPIRNATCQPPRVRMGMPIRPKT